MNMTTAEPWWDWPLETPITGIMSWDFQLRQTWRRRISRWWTTSREKGRPSTYFLQKDKKNKINKNSRRPPGRRYIISPGVALRLKCLIDRPSNQQPLQFSPIHLWPVSEANCLSWGTEPQKWPTPIASEWGRPDGGRGRPPTRERQGERPREREHIPKRFKCFRNGWDSGAICLLSGEVGDQLRGQRWQGICKTN